MSHEQIEQAILDWTRSIAVQYVSAFGPELEPLPLGGPHGLNPPHTQS